MDKRIIAYKGYKSLTGNSSDVNIRSDAFLELLALFVEE